MQGTTSWDDARIMLGANGPELTTGGDVRGSSGGSGPSRTQDDARVGYFSQRPPAPPQGGVHQPYNAGPPAAAKRWAPAGTEVFVEQVARMLTTVLMTFF